MIGFIYKLTDNSDKVYYGSTIKTLKYRLFKHKSPTNHCRSKMMDKDTMKLECLEQYYFDTDVDYKPFLIKRESYYIRNFECINYIIPDRTKKEYYQKNKEILIIKGKEYYEKNKKKILLKNKVKFTCICGGKYTYEHKSKHLKTKKHIAYSLSTISS